MSHPGSIRFRGVFTSARLADRQHRGQVTGHLHAQHAVDRRQHDALDESADDLLRLRAACFAAVRGEQVLDLGAVNLCQLRVEQGRGGWLGRFGEHILERGLAAAEPVELVAHQRRVHPVQDGVGQPMDAGLDTLQLLAMRCTVTVALAGQPVALGDVLRDERLDDVGSEHVVLQRRKHELLQLADADRQTVAAAGLAIVAARMAARAQFADLAVVRPANPAGHLAGQQVFGALLGPERCHLGAVRAGGLFLACLHLCPELVADDAQMRCLGGLLDPLGGCEGVALARLWVLAERLALMLGSTDIGLVVEDAGAALLVAVDGRGRPFTAARSRHAAAVEVRGDVLAGAPGGIFFADPHDGRCLGRVYLKVAGDAVAARVELEVELVAIGAPAGVQAFHMSIRERIAGLARCRRDLFGVHRPLHADVQPGDLALSHRHQPDAEELQPLVDLGGVRLAARHAVEFVGQYDIDLTTLARGQHRLDAGAVKRRARDRLVGPCANLLPAGLRNIGSHVTVLHRDGLGLLHIGRVAGVERDPHHFTSPSLRALRPR
uniref:hypothetical protein n=1 Tax=Sphingomonas sp. CFBP 8764 TaxID=2775275 RepID=UPI001FD59810|nr:hypothetical protein [Sphingomonas sp. CFBP 8764]